MATAESLIASSRAATATATATAITPGEGKQKSAEHEPEQESLPNDEKIPITKKKKTTHKLPRFARAGALLSSTLYKNITCSENVPQTSMMAPAKFFIDQFKAAEDEEAETQKQSQSSWVQQIIDQKADICVLPPSIQSSIGTSTFTSRIRQHALQFVVGDSLQSTISGDLLQQILLSCDKHVIIPLRITLIRYHVYHTPEVRFNIVLETVPYSLYSDKKFNEKRNWVQARVHQNIVGMDSVSLAIGYDLQWNTYSETRHTLYDGLPILPLRAYEWLKVLHDHPDDGAMHFVKKVQRSSKDTMTGQVISTETAYWLEQPDRKTNISPNLFSFEFARNLHQLHNGSNIQHVENSTDRVTTSDDTKTAVSTKSYWKYPRKTFQGLADALKLEAEEFTSQIAMNLDGGLTLRLIPMGNGGGNDAQKKKDNKPMDINVTIQLDYLVL